MLQPFPEGTRLILVRHGESEANLQGIISNRTLHHALTPRGRQQALALAEQLQGLDVSCIYTSPILRARETAGLLSRNGRIDIRVHEGLREPDCGVLEGRQDPQAWQMHREMVQRWHVGDIHACPDQGESFAVVKERFKRCLAQVLKDSRTGEHVLLVTHGLLLGSALPAMTTNLPANHGIQHPVDHTSPVVLDASQDPNSGKFNLTCVLWGGEPIH